jgi:membrane protein implicated in regulation of membrane protease activity
MTTPTALVLLPLAVQKGPDPADVKPGWLGFTVFLVLAVAVALLARSFVKQLKKIDFEEEPDPDHENGDQPSNPTNA